MARPARGAGDDHGAVHRVAVDPEERELVAALPVPDARGAVEGRGDDPPPAGRELGAGHRAGVTRQDDGLPAMAHVPDVSRAVAPAGHEGATVVTERDAQHIAERRLAGQAGEGQAPARPPVEEPQAVDRRGRDQAGVGRAEGGVVAPSVDARACAPRHRHGPAYTSPPVAVRGDHEAAIRPELDGVRLAPGRPREGSRPPGPPTPEHGRLVGHRGDDASESPPGVNASDCTGEDTMLGRAARVHDRVRHTVTRPSLPPVAATAPWGSSASAVIQAGCERPREATAGTAQTRAVPSELAVTTRRPSGLSSASLRVARCPLRSAIMLPLTTSQTRASPSRVAVTTRSPRGLRVALTRLPRTGPRAPPAAGPRTCCRRTPACRPRRRCGGRPG